MGRAYDIAANQPWAILPESLTTILSIAGRYNEDIDAVAAKLGRPLDNTRNVTIRGGTAVIPIHGPIARYMNLFSAISGGTSVQALATDFGAAMDDRSVDRIILDIDSPGGTVTGIAEFAELIKTAEKPVIAYVSGSGGSAAYWIASAADAVIVNATAAVGSIGVVAPINTDKPKNQIEIVSSQSPRKRPDIETDEGVAQVQDHVDRLAEIFIETVAENRGVSAETVATKFGAGGLLIGADAVAAGMADGVGTLERLLAENIGATGAEIMTTESDVKSTNAPKITREYLNANHSVLVEDIKTAGYEIGVTDGLKAGADGERDRIRDVEAQFMPGHEAIIKTMMYDGKTTGPEAAVTILRAEKEARGNAAARMADEAPPPVPAASTDSAAESTDHLPAEDRCQAEWKKNPDIREEFGSVETYIAYTTAHESGRVKVLGGGK
ncbi:MAG: S49 family peptidase [Desulfobulbaceae bacterium]|nr:S49 family peptidase [Desulfobulbaceae bacterium]